MIVTNEDAAPAQEELQPGGEASADSGKAASDGDDSDKPEGDPDAHGAEFGLDDGMKQQVNNIFKGAVLVGDGGTLGFALEEGVRRETGQVPETEITVLRSLYHRTEDFQSALTRLRKVSLVILAGGEGTGRAAASLMLADDVRDPAARILRLPPTRTLAALAKQKFKSGQVYVLHDWIAGAATDAALVRFDAKQLADRLKQAGAHLVITATSTARAARAVPEHEIRWNTPDPAALFAYCFARVDKLAGLEQDLPDLEQCAIRLGSPRRIVAMALRLCDGAEEALRCAEDTEQREVAAWFEHNSRPSRRAVRAAAVLALACRAGDEPVSAPGVTQRGFEELCFALGKAEARFKGERSPEEAPLPDDDETFPQSRQGLLREARLDDFTVPFPESAAVGVEHMPGFRTRSLRDLFLKGLCRSYGEELWSPVREWAAEVVARPGVTDAHLAIAYGIGRMARYATKEVREAYLEQWAQGDITMRSCAVFVLWSMASEDDLAREALRIATEWVWGRGQERAMVAAIALGGALGKRYPSEAMWWLWKLARRGQRINHLACLAVGNLLAIDASSDDPNVARYLAGCAEAALEPGVAMPERRKVLSALLEILAAPDAETGVPAIQRVLRGSDAAAKPLGRVWAALLRSSPHRALSIDVLHATLASLSGTPDGVTVAQRLGRSILPRLNPTQCRQLELGLRRPESARDRLLAREVILAFLEPAAQERPS